MPLNSDKRCFGISTVAEALLDGKQVDQTEHPSPAALAKRIYEGLATGSQLHFNSHLKIGDRLARIDSREALELLSTLVADRYKHDHRKLIGAPRGAQKLVAALDKSVRSQAALDALLDADPDKLVAFCGIGVRSFPNGTDRDTDHVFLIHKRPDEKKVIYDPNEPGGPISCRLSRVDGLLTVEWTCKYKDTGQTTTQAYTIVPTASFVRDAFQEK